MNPVSRSFECPNCGAQLHPSGHDATITCEFCGAMSPITSSSEAHKEPAQAAPSSSARAPWRWIAIGVPIAAIGFWLVGKKAPAESGSQATSLVQTISSAMTTQERTATAWQHSPIILDVNGDGVEDVIGQWDTGHCTTGLIDGKTRRVLFSVVHDKNCGWFQPFTVASNVLFLAPVQTPSVELYALPAGTDIGRVDLDHEPTALLGHGQQVWVDMAGSEALIDVTTKSVIAPWSTTNNPPPKRPAWVPFTPVGGLLPPGHYEGEMRCSPSPCWDANLQRPVPPVPNMIAYQVLINDGQDAAVAVGNTARGTTLPMAAGFSVASKTSSWTHTFGTPQTAGTAGSSAVLTQNTFYLEYSAKDPAKPDDSQRSRLAALSATTGELLWDVAIDDAGTSGTAQIVAGAYVYVALAHSLELRDPKTGAVVAELP
jgi:hypothetical protein